MKILVTGGAGFVGSSIAKAFKKEDPSNVVVVFDNLSRRGSEINLASFKELGIQFIHGDVRTPSDLDTLPGNFDLFIEASAEPSVLAGLNSSPNYLLQTNLVGTLNCLEFARQRAKEIIFLSTSRVYSIGPLREIQTEEAIYRFTISSNQIIKGVSEKGVSEEFPTNLPRSLYGASKLASELIIQEYVDTYGIKAVINRCGVIAGPGQFGKVDQGVFTLWVANHYFNKPLKYTGFGGTGKQVRDLLHPDDLYLLIQKQISSFSEISGRIFNVGGGLDNSVSLLELTRLCQESTGNKAAIEQDPKTSPVDIPIYISDNSACEATFNWQPNKKVSHIVEDIYSWIRRNEGILRPVFC